MREIVYLSQLEDIAILWHGDLYALALFILRSYDVTDSKINAMNKSSIQKSRPTLHGIAGDFAMLTKVPIFVIEKKINALGLSFGATVDFDIEPAKKSS